MTVAPDAGVAKSSVMELPVQCTPTVPSDSEYAACTGATGATGATVGAGAGGGGVVTGAIVTGAAGGGGAIVGAAVTVGGVVTAGLTTTGAAWAAGAAGAAGGSVATGAGAGAAGPGAGAARVGVGAPARGAERGAVRGATVVAGATAACRGRDCATPPGTGLGGAILRAGAARSCATVVVGRVTGRVVVARVAARVAGGGVEGRGVAPATVGASLEVNSTTSGACAGTVVRATSITRGAITVMVRGRVSSGEMATTWGELATRPATMATAAQPRDEAATVPANQVETKRRRLRTASSVTVRTSVAR